jgi:hypothetical protein
LPPLKKSKSANEVHMPGTTPTKLSEFLIKLGEDPKTAQDFRSKPLETMTGAGLTDQDKHIILSGNSHRIAQALRPSVKGTASGDTTVVVVVVVVV